MQTGAKTIQEVYSWLHIAEPNDKFTYAILRCLTDDFAAYSLGREIWSMALAGRIYLVRRRVPYTLGGVFEYIAIRASNPPIRKLVARDYGDPTTPREKRKATEEVV